MTAVMFDSDNPQALLAPAAAGVRVATYADLLTPELAKELGHALVVIHRGHGDPLGLATVADIEPGALSVATGVALIKQWMSAGRPFATAYHDRSEWAAVNSAMGSTPCHHWVATLDGTCNPNGQRPDAVQILGAAKTGFHADMSVVWNDAWHPVSSGIAPGNLPELKAASAAAQGWANKLFGLIAGM